ncbi:MAG: DNA ligase [Coprothermobacterota bacterium]|nr:DNA ligase [Coprothermobacterota bacterium]
MESLAKYREKRQFDQTPEPVGGENVPWKGIYVVQKHNASHLHYDFRIEIGGALASWAVPKGPSMNPKDKRLAMHVEDHPMEYANFTGVIPAGNYGAGTVEIWDCGHFQPLVDPGQGIASGVLDFVLDGERLHGGFALIKLQRGKGDNWLLFKKKDEFADPLWTMG